MSKEKVSETYTVQADQKAWLEQMARTHNLTDASKALRVLLDYAIEDGDEQDIFGKIRCTRC